MTHIITEKEKKSISYKEGRLDALSDEKAVKIKKFAKEYIAKVLRKLEKSKSDQSPFKPSSSHHKDRNRDRIHDEPSGSVPSLDARRNGEDGDGDGDGDGDEDGEDAEMVMSVEQAMDLGSDSEDGDHDPYHGPDGDADMDMQHSSDEVDHDPSPMEGVVHPPASVSVTPITPPQQQQTLDPRLMSMKHRSEESGWDPDAIRVANGLDEVHV